MTLIVVAIAVVVILIIVVVYFGQAEHYRSCRQCKGYYSISPAGAPAAINPFMWPYSGTGCTQGIFMRPKDQWANFGVGANPLVSPNTPDHAINE